MDIRAIRIEVLEGVHRDFVKDVRVMGRTDVVMKAMVLGEGWFCKWEDL